MSGFPAKLWAMLVLASGLAFGVPLLSESGTFSTTNDVFLRTFTFDPAVHGSTLQIQTWGYGGTGNAPGGKNALGQVISGGGFDPVLWLFQGTGPMATLLAWNDDGLCPPGTPNPHCYDASLNLGPNGGVYTLVLTMYNVRPVNFAVGGLLSGGWTQNFFTSFGDRTPFFAVDVMAPNAPEPPQPEVPEPSTYLLLGGGLAVLAVLRRARS